MDKPSKIGSPGARGSEGDEELWERLETKGTLFLSLSLSLFLCSINISIN
jgi:hypothetical protein